MPGPESNDPLLTRLRELSEGERGAVLRQAVAIAPTLGTRMGELTTFLIESGNENEAGDLGLAASEAHALEWALGVGTGETVGTEIGPYVLRERLGEGGFGTVWKARQEAPVRREVALKILKAGMDTNEFVARFEAERQALAMMDHSGIAHVFDAGATENGRPYFVMELVEGIPINRFCDEHRLSIESRLRLFIEVCHAVQHAHQKGVIHRDLKPSNILVSLQDSTPAPKIIDFGIAKATARPLTDKSFHTQLATFLGTPIYSSPEQIEGRHQDVDTRSDLYSLGVILYELLSGKLPFDPDTLTSSGIEEMRRIVREVDPPRLSTRLRTLAVNKGATIARQRGTDAPKLSAILRGDLDWIVMRCLEKDRARRYETANALALDLERMLHHEPVLARPPSRSYRWGKYVRRHRVGVAAVAGILAVLLLGIIGSTWQAVRATRAEHDAAIALDNETLERQRAEAAQARERALREQAEALRFESIARKQALEEFGDTTEALAHAIAALERGDSWARRELAMIALWKGPTRFRLPEADRYQPAGYVDFSPDGSWLATGSRQPQVLLWPRDGGDPVMLPVDEGLITLGAQYSPSGQWLLTSHSSNRTQIGPFHMILWKTEGGERQKTWPLEDWAPFWFHPDERKLLAYSLRREVPYAGVAWWSLETGEVTPLGSPRDEPPLESDWFPPQSYKSFFPSQDGRWLVSWEGSEVYVSALGETSLGPRIRVGRHDRAVQSASLGPEGRLVASADEEETRIWFREPHKEPLLHVPGPVKGASFDLAGSRLFTGGSDWRSLLVAHDLRRPVGSKPLPLFPALGPVEDAHPSPDGRWVAVGCYSAWPGREVWLHPMRAAWPFYLDLIPAPPANVLDLGGRLSPDGHSVILHEHGQARLIDLRSPELARRVVFEAPQPGVTFPVKFDRQGKHLLVGTYASGAWLVSLADGTPRQLPDAPVFTLAVAFSPSGEHLAAGGGWHLPPEERYARILDQEGRLIARMEAADGGIVQDLSFLSETVLLVASSTGLRWWNFGSNEVRLLHAGPHGGIELGEHSFLVNTPEAFWIYDRATLTGRVLKEMRPRFITALELSPDESFAVAGYSDGSFRVRHLAEDRPHHLTGVEGRILDLWIGPRGRWFGALTGQGQLSYWPVPHGCPLMERPIEEFLALVRSQTNIRVVSDPDASEGYRYEQDAFPGWESAPCWQEWYSEDTLEDPPWTPMLDLKNLEETESIVTKE